MEKAELRTGLESDFVREELKNDPSELQHEWSRILTSPEVGADCLNDSLAKWTQLLDNRVQLKQDAPNGVPTSQLGGDQANGCGSQLRGHGGGGRGPLPAQD